MIYYEEVGFSDSITDDVKNQTKKYDKEIYKKQLNNKVGKLGLYLKKDELFSESDCQNLYSIVKRNKTDEKASKKRNLNTNLLGLISVLKNN